MRGLFWITVLAGASYSFAAWGQIDAAAWDVVWKMSGVGLLALWAAAQARSADGLLIAMALALGALGDLLIEIFGLTAGGAAFALGHVFAITLYMRRRRVRLSASQRLFGYLLAPVTIWVSAIFAAPAGQAIGVGIYAAVLGIMASSAWTSRFSRYQVGIGAVLFVVSDLLIFAELGPLAGSPLPGLLIWPIYFAGQALIAWGVVRTLAMEQGRDDESVHHRL